MGGKGRKRREKNYRAAHGDKNRRLPPPPVSYTIDALPSKLRQLMKFTRPQQQQPGSAEVLVDNAQRNKGDGDNAQKKGDVGVHTDKLDNISNLGENIDFENFEDNNKGHDENENEKKKKKRKRKGVEDLRFELAELTGISTKRKERKKRRLVEMKQKHKKGTAKENLDFPGREQIKFGDVVKAPPKLVTVPKGKKSVQDAYKERLRLEAVDGYRSKRGWASRPGIHLPPPDIASA